jgi:hypothetical protein
MVIGNVVAGILAAISADFATRRATRRTCGHLEEVAHYRVGAGPYQQRGLVVNRVLHKAAVEQDIEKI